MSRVVCLSAVLVCASAAFAQTPAAPGDQTGTQSADTVRQRPLTPEEQRQRQIRLFDPLDKSTPNAADDDSTQSPPAAPKYTPAPARNRSEQPLPGSVAATDQPPTTSHRQGPQVVGDNSDTSADVPYSGPAVLSRSYTIARPMVPQTVRWSPYIGFSETWDNGLNSGAVRSDGTMASQSSLGTALNWGISGRHLWKRSQLGLHYVGTYNHYYSNASYTGANQSLSLDYAREISRRLTLNVVTSGVRFSQSYALQNQDFLEGTSVANINLGSSPGVQIFDQGTSEFSTQVSGTWRQSYRLSFSGGGGVFFVRRAGTGLVGTTGYQAQGDVNYRLSRKMTVGSYYSFTDYVFTQRVNVSDYHTVGGIFSYAFNRTMELRLRVGVSFLENAGLQSVAIPPAIAALLGQQSALVDIYNRHSISDISAQFAKDFGRNRTASISYAHGIAPGNGLQLTSRQESIAATFAMRLLRRYGASFGVGRSTLVAESQALGAPLGSYAANYASFSVAREYQHGVSATFGFDFRKFSLSNSPILQNQFRITTGINWTPQQNWLHSL